MEIKIDKTISDRFYDYIFDWEHEEYILCGGYGSGKSYSTAFKIILLCLQEKRTVLVIRETFSSIYESCYSLFMEILADMDLLTINSTDHRSTKFVCYYKSPLAFLFPNGSRIIFKGMDEPQKLKSINNVSIVWLEEAAEIKYAGYKELLGRLRTPDKSLHFILTFNPTQKSNWVYQHFFQHIDENGEEVTILDDKLLYERKTIIQGKKYYHYSVCDDNPFLPESYVERLDDIKNYDPDLYMVARWGHFGATGTRVLPQFEVAKTNKEVFEAVKLLPSKNIHCGMDFGFEESYNAIACCAVDLENRILYIYREYYKNHMTDYETIQDEDFLRFKRYYIIADSAEPKAIAFYNKMGFKMRGCKKFAGSRLAYIKKIKRFKKIICAPQCVNAIRELKDLSYAQDKNGNYIYDEFNIDSHIMSCLWYALDVVDVSDIKHSWNNTRKGDCY